MPRTKLKFSRRSFVWKQLSLLAALQLVVRLIFPSYWMKQWSAGWVAFTWTFIGLHALVALFEFALHKWVLHKVAWKWLLRIFRAHENHHELTDVYLDVTAQKVVSRYPIETEEQNVDAAFPFWVVIVVWFLFAVVLAIPQWLFPQVPFFLAGSLAIVFSNMGYELFHAEFHRPYADWEERTERSKYRAIWKVVYGCHLLHHANQNCNLWVFGFFGLPLWDWLFGTLVIPKRLLLNDRTATVEDFPRPRPRWPIPVIDRWAAERQRRIAPPQRRSA